MTRSQRNTKLDYALYSLAFFAASFFIYQLARSWSAIDLEDEEAVAAATERPTSGSVLKNIPLVTHFEDDVEREADLHTLVGRSDVPCTILVFFSPACPICEGRAPAWREVDHVRANGKAAAVRWVSVQPHLETNGSFLAQHRLPAPWHSLSGVEEGLSTGGRSLYRSCRELPPENWAG